MLINRTSRWNRSWYIQSLDSNWLLEGKHIHLDMYPHLMRCRRQWDCHRFPNKNFLILKGMWDFVIILFSNENRWIKRYLRRSRIFSILCLWCHLPTLRLMGSEHRIASKFPCTLAHPKQKQRTIRIVWVTADRVDWRRTRWLNLLFFSVQIQLTQFSRDAVRSKLDCTRRTHCADPVSI